MTTRKRVVFRHASALGNARAGDLFDRVSVWRGEHPVGHAALGNLPPARRFADYEVRLDQAGLPDGVEMIERV